PEVFGFLAVIRSEGKKRLRDRCIGSSKDDSMKILSARVNGPFPSHKCGELAWFVVSFRRIHLLAPDALPDGGSFHIAIALLDVGRRQAPHAAGRILFQRSLKVF